MEVRFSTYVFGIDTTCSSESSGLRPSLSSSLGQPILVLGPLQSTPIDTIKVIVPHLGSVSDIQMYNLKARLSPTI